MHHRELKERLFRHYKLNSVPSDYKELLLHLNNSDSWIETVFPYDWVNKILSYEVEHCPATNELTLVQFKDYPESSMAFPTSHGLDCILQEYLLLQVEQSIHSPHRYQLVPENTSIIDVGASEGIFGKRYCFDSNEIHMFDSKEWLHAGMFNVNHSEVYYHTDLVTKDYSIDFELGKPLGCIKVDVDGPELEVLEKFKDWILQYKPMLQVAVYHRQQELQEVVELLKSYGYEFFSVGEGWMLYPNDDIQFAPYFRKGVLIAKSQLGEEDCRGVVSYDRR